MKDFIFFDDNTSFENKEALELINVSKFPFTTQSFKKENLNYYVKNKMLYRKKVFFKFSGFVYFEGSIETSEITCKLSCSAEFLNGILCDSIKLLNFTINFKRKRSFNFLDSIKCMIWKK